jgi:hypothetical protein
MAFRYVAENRSAYDSDKGVTIEMSHKFYDTTETPLRYVCEEFEFTFFVSIIQEPAPISVTLKNGNISTPKILVDATIEEKSLWMALLTSGHGIEFARQNYNSIKKTIEEGKRSAKHVPPAALT